MGAAAEPARDPRPHLWQGGGEARSQDGACDAGRTVTGMNPVTSDVSRSALKPRARTPAGIQHLSRNATIALQLPPYARCFRLTAAGFPLPVSRASPTAA